MKILAVLRDKKFSPNAVERDKAIMMAVVGRLQLQGHTVSVTDETQLPDNTGCELILSMGRLPQTLCWLERQKARVINTPAGVASCTRSVVERLMRETGVPVPPEEGSHGYWLKRGDAAAQEKGDVVFAADEAALEQAVAVFRQRGINDYTVSAHVVGDVVKFYGVKNTGFFRYYYPADDGNTKFGDELRNGQAHHYSFSVDELQRTADGLAAVVGVEVYGGDCIVRQDGSFCIIDFNDWPSFSRCREEAADAIVKLITDYGDI